MRRSKEIMILLTLLLSAMVFVLWYVIDRRAKNRATPTKPMVTAPEPGPLPPTGTAQPHHDIALDATTERKTIDFSSGAPVVKNTPEDQAAIDAALKDMKEATESITFEVTPKPKPTEPPAPPAPL